MNKYDVLFDPSESDFGGLFNQWRFFRVKKIEQHFTKEWFNGKKVLELGCGYGNVGHYLSLLGADVTFSDARQEALDIVKSKNSSFKTIRLDQETDWTINEHFDLIVHFGISYNLNNWKQDLIRTMHHGSYVAYETAVAKYTTEVEYKILDYNYTSIMHGPYSNIGSLVSGTNIENTIAEFGASFDRCFDSDLNTMFHKYDWKETELKDQETTGTVKSWWKNDHFGGRRYWIIHCK